MVYCDNNESVIEWGSEEVVIPYKSPWDGRIHRYFPDFYCKIRKHDGSVERLIIEVKPKIQIFTKEIDHGNKNAISRSKIIKSIATK